MNTKHLKAKILDLAIRGKLVPQDPSEGNVADLLKEHNNIPEDEIPFEIPENWCWCRLPELCTIPITDGTHQTPTYSDKENGIPFLSSKDVTKQIIDWSNIKYITKELHEELYKRVAPQKGDVLLAKNGTTGVAALVEDDRIFDIYVTLAVLRPNKTFLSPRYLLWTINSPVCKEQFNAHLLGIGVPNLHLYEINKTLIPLPPLSEQKRIVSAIEKAFEQIDIIEKNKLNLKTYIKQTKSKVLDLAIHGKLVKQNPNEGNAADLLKIEEVIQDDIPFEIPMNWCWCRLTSLCEYGKCKNADPSELKPDSWILDLEDIEKDTGVIKCIKTFSERNSLSTKHFFTKGTVLYSKLRPYLNKVVIAPKDGFCTSEILPLDFNGKYINTFAQKLLMSPYFLSTVNMLTYGVKMPRLGTNEAKQILLPLPPLQEQQRIVERIEQIFEQLYILEKSIGE